MESGVIWVYVGLMFFGIIYAAVVFILGNAEMTEGFSSILVVIGVLATLAGAWVIEATTGRVTMFQLLLAFACSGSPMIVGDIGAFLARKRNGRKIWKAISQRGSNDSTA